MGLEGSRSAVEDETGFILRIQQAAAAQASDMGSGDSKLHFRKAVIQLTTKTQVGVSTCIVRTGSDRDVLHTSVF